MFSLMQLQILGYIALAMALGGVIGFEREKADKPAGLRTHMLVAGAAALLVSLGSVIVGDFDSSPSIVQTDPIRILEAIITGVSFLGAGTILRRRDGENVEGLTTAASLLFTAGIGVSVALEMLLFAVGAVALALLVLRVAKQMEKRWL